MISLDLDMNIYPRCTSEGNINDEQLLQGKVTFEILLSWIHTWEWPWTLSAIEGKEEYSLLI